MSKPNLDAAEYYINRELSWLEFNDRVLRQGISRDVPLLERLKFLAIVSSNMDEFFMIRVAGLKQQAEAGVTARDISGMDPGEQLARISERAHRLVQEQAEAVRSAFAELDCHKIRLLKMADLDGDQRRYADRYFTSDILPLLTPLAVEELQPFPILPQRALNLALVLSPSDDAAEEKLAIVPVPHVLPRFLTLPASEGLALVLIEDVVEAHAMSLFTGFSVRGSSMFRITRDADVAVDDDDAEDLMREMAQAVRERGRRDVVRLEVSAATPAPIMAWLTELCRVSESDVYRIDGMLDASGLMAVANRPGFEPLHDREAPPQDVRGLSRQDDIWQALQAQDVLLCHPYESFEPVLRLLDAASEDPAVLTIKQTLYRTSGVSPVIKALARAAENGKQVTVLVELKARFDESRNIVWARRLEDAGCHVIYGIAGLKTHSKILLIVRREANGIRRYVHLATGNYNERTARLYSDIGLMTSDRAFGLDASAFFNLLTGYSQDVGWEKLVIAPRGLRRRFIDLIEREIRASTPDEPGLIMVKVNSLHDRGICQALYRASQAGVKVLLNVRGICCLRPGIEGVSENIQVTSILDRYLEHARIFYFRNGGHEEVYLSSADWMSRNLDKRLEIMFPVLQPDLRTRLAGMMRTYLADNAKAMRLRPDGTYEPVPLTGERVRAQKRLYRDVVEAVKASEQAPIEFKPLTRGE